MHNNDDDDDNDYDNHDDLVITLARLFLQNSWAKITLEIKWKFSEYNKNN